MFPLCHLLTWKVIPQRRNNNRKKGPKNNQLPEKIKKNSLM